MPPPTVHLKRTVRAPQSSVKASVQPIRKPADDIQVQQPQAAQPSLTKRRLNQFGFYRVADRMFVGRRPDEERIRELQVLGIKHIINLEDRLSLRRTLRRSEHERATAAGIRVADMPLSPVFPLRFSRVATIIRHMTNRDTQPVYVHCLYGQERALFLAGLIRVYYDGWTPERAYREMRRFGFRPYLVPVLTTQYWRWSQSAEKRAELQPTLQRPSRGDLPPESTANEGTHPDEMPADAVAEVDELPTIAEIE